jgi:N-acetylglutamate synthase-like GNAT family acetyltransferase
MTRRLMLEVNGVGFVVADCYQSGCKKTFMLDRSREHWFDEEGTSRLSQGQEASDP